MIGGELTSIECNVIMRHTFENSLKKAMEKLSELSFVSDGEFRLAVLNLNPNLDLKPIPNPPICKRDGALIRLGLR